MSDPTRWGDAPRLTRQLREGQPGVPALPMHRPFAGWVARGWRRVKYLDYWPPKGGLPRVCYLYSTATRAPDYWFDRDLDDLGGPLDSVDDCLRELNRRQQDPASNAAKVIVGVGVLHYVSDPGEDGAFEFSGGALLPRALPLESFSARSYGGVFYPFGREGR